ncbi:thr operon leader peptide [Salmonella enterica subsp. enterica serovar Infantis]
MNRISTTTITNITCSTGNGAG